MGIPASPYVCNCCHLGQVKEAVRTITAGGLAYSIGSTIHRSFAKLVILPRQNLRIGLDSENPQSERERQLDNNSAPSPSEDRALLLAQIREIYGRIAYVHKTHEKQADICLALDQRQRWLRVGLTALSSGAFLASLAGLLLAPQWAALVTSFIAVLLSAASLGDKTFMHGEEMQQHRATAAKLWSLRESYLSLIVDLNGSASTVDEVRSRRDHLQEMAERILADAPRTTGKAYLKAQEGLQSKEDLTFTEREIDLLLPVQLRNGIEVGNDSNE